MKYAAYDANSIYAVGDTEAEAVAAASDALGSEASPIFVAPISEDFAAYIDREGWEGKTNSFEIDCNSGMLIDTTTKFRDRLDAAAVFMRPDIREDVHDDERAVCPHWFFAEYAQRHAEKFGEEFRLD